MLRSPHSFFPQYTALEFSDVASSHVKVIITSLVLTDYLELESPNLLQFRQLQ